MKSTPMSSAWYLLLIVTLGMCVCEINFHIVNWITEPASTLNTTLHLVLSFFGAGCIGVGVGKLAGAP